MTIKKEGLEIDSEVQNIGSKDLGDGDLLICQQKRAAKATMYLQIESAMLADRICCDMAKKRRRDKATNNNFPRILKIDQSTYPPINGIYRVLLGMCTLVYNNARCPIYIGNQMRP